MSWFVIAALGLQYSPAEYHPIRAGKGKRISYQPLKKVNFSVIIQLCVSVSEKLGSKIWTVYFFRYRKNPNTG